MSTEDQEDFVSPYHCHGRTQLTDEEHMQRIFLAFQTERLQEHFAEEAKRKLKDYPGAVVRVAPHK